MSSILMHCQSKYKVKGTCRSLMIPYYKNVIQNGLYDIYMTFFYK